MINFHPFISFLDQPAMLWLFLFNSQLSASNEMVLEHWDTGQHSMFILSHVMDIRMDSVREQLNRNSLFRNLENMQ